MLAFKFSIIQNLTLIDYKFMISISFKYLKVAVIATKILYNLAYLF